MRRWPTSRGMAMRMQISFCFALARFSSLTSAGLGSLHFLDRARWCHKNILSLSSSSGWSERRLFIFPGNFFFGKSLRTLICSLCDVSTHFAAVVAADVASVFSELFFFVFVLFFSCLFAQNSLETHDNGCWCRNRLL